MLMLPAYSQHQSIPIRKNISQFMIENNCTIEIHYHAPCEDPNIRWRLILKGAKGWKRGDKHWSVPGVLNFGVQSWGYTPQEALDNFYRIYSNRWISINGEYKKFSAK